MSRLMIQAWDPSFGSEASLEGDQQEISQRSVNPEVELGLADWKPISVSERSVEPVAFIDGIRRIDARGVLESSNKLPTPALFVSLAAGICLCDGTARVREVSVRRLLLCKDQLDPFETGAGTYHFEPVSEEGAPGLLNGLRQALRELEREIATNFGKRCLTIVDGPLSTGTRQDPLIGYIKSHHARYLTGAAEETLARLDVKQRTPLFRIESPWPRYSFYLRLPGSERGGVWSSLCRVEIAGEWPAEEAVQRANQVAALLPRFASGAYRDPRAPQNLYPIAGLERTLRDRIGDPVLILRSILQT